MLLLDLHRFKLLLLLIIGALFGFLWLNCHPAKIFMGDVGSLPLGSILGIIAVLTKTEILLLLLGGIFVIEAISVIIQVLYYKKTKLRFFKMAPIHHHFELNNIVETQIVIRFFIVTIILVVASLSIIYL